MMSHDAVYVTGVGLVTPLGGSREKTWARLLAGDAGLLAENGRLMARVDDFWPTGLPRPGDFAVAAAIEALRQAKYDPWRANGADIGVAIGQSKPFLFYAPPASCAKRAEDAGLVPRSTERRDGLSGPPDGIWGRWAGDAVREALSLTGPASNPVAACATGIAAIGEGISWLRSGEATAVLVGAAEASLHPLYEAGFAQMGVLIDSDVPAAARPFDRRRSGFAMGEGAAVLLIETEASFSARGAAPLARVESLVLRQASTDVLRFDSGGAGVAALVKRAIGEAGKIDWVNAHGTGTRFNDEMESRGLAEAFSGKAAPAVSSTKAATGHLLGAAGAVEAAFAVLSITSGAVPATLNLETPDPDTGLNLVRGRSQSGRIEAALSLSYGFGGQMGAVLFRRP